MKVTKFRNSALVITLTLAIITSTTQSNQSNYSNSILDSLSIQTSTQINEPKNTESISPITRMFACKTSHFKSQTILISILEINSTFASKFTANLRTRKLVLMILGFTCAAAFWLLVVQYSLPLSKQASIEISVLKHQSQMTTVEKLIYLNKLKNKEKKKQAMALQPI